MARPAVTTRPLGMRASMYLARLDWHLQGAVAGAQRKRILRSLRDEIRADSRPVTAVLADLGSPRTLAHRYSEGEMPRPLWQVGIITAAAALTAYWVFFGVFAAGMLVAVTSAPL